jgi:CubicO group peptidase (beta-lactamase class C family)
MRRLRGFARLVAVLAILVPCSLHAQGAAGQNEPPLKKPDQETIAALKERIPELLKESSVPGLSLALIRDGKTYWVQGFGVRDAKTSQPVTDDTIFEAASLSKPVFAYGVFKLVDQGKLDLDAPLTRYLPKPYIEGDARLEKITARIVLSHRTGFPNWRPDENGLTIHFTPGERFSYSGEGFVYLAKVVEQVTGKPLNDYMAEAVFQPLGMKSSSYVWRLDYEARTATGHDASGQPGEKWKPKEANAASSLQTTAGDYALFVEALMNGAGLKPETLREMERPQIAVDPTCTNYTEREPKELSKSVFWGLGIGIQETKQGESLWHWGDNGSFKCYLVAFPKQKIGVAMFMNGANGLSIASEVVRIALGGEQPAFQWVKYDRYDSPAMRFAKAAREKGAEAAITEFQPAWQQGEISEEAINSTGYQLLALRKTADAIRIFQLNVKLHAESSNAYDSLGEAYMANGDKELAIKNYEKSLEMNAKNSNAVEMLKKLKAEQHLLQSNPLSPVFWKCSF